MKKNIIKAVVSLSIMFSTVNCQNEQMNKENKNVFTPKEYVELKHPEWSKDAVLYQVNIRQYTPEGTFEAFEKHLPRLKQLGVDILWLMPIHPIGEKNRKGGLGSYYSVKDYYGVNPEFGNLDDLKHLVNKAHEMGMYVILDWVANHSAWDNPLTESHPDWYTKTADGNFQPTPWYDWDDIIDFDYNVPELRQYMTEVMKYWVSEADIDGYRCDVAGFIPVDFWGNLRYELDNIKPVFMLAEWESRDIHKKAFDASYAWELFGKIEGVVKGDSPGKLVEYMAHDVNTFPRNAYRMTFTDNHDMNSWHGTKDEIFGDAFEMAVVFTFTVNGIPLIYNGQEAGLNHRLKFFDKDLIEWKNDPANDLFKKLIALKKNNKALWNGKYGGEMHRIYSDKMPELVSFFREMKGDKIVALFNFSKDKIEANLDAKFISGKYFDLSTGEEIELSGSDKISLNPWSYLIYSSTNIKH